MPSGAIRESGDQDPLVQVGRRARDGQRTEEAQDARAAADLGGARGTAPDVGGQARGIAGIQLIEQELVDEGPGARAVKDLGGRHTLYMSAAPEKVAFGFRKRPTAAGPRRPALSASGPTPR